MIGALRAQTGRIEGHPYVRVGEGDRTLVVVPGLNDPLHAVGDSWWFPRLMAVYLRRYADTHTVYMVSRPHGLPADASTRDLAAGYGPVLESLGGADLLGLSMGGFLVEHVAAENPDLVGRAVLGLAADRLSTGGRGIVDRWRAWASEDRWLPIYLEAFDAISRGLKRRALRLGARGYDLAVSPAAPADFGVSAAACLDHDGDRLSSVEVPTLVVGADRDPFFSLAGYRRAARAIPDSRLAILRGSGHEAPVEYPRAFDGTIGAFLARE